MPLLTWFLLPAFFEQVCTIIQKAIDVGASKGLEQCIEAIANNLLYLNETDLTLLAEVCGTEPEPFVSILQKYYKQPFYSHKLLSQVCTYLKFRVHPSASEVKAIIATLDFEHLSEASLRTVATHFVFLAHGQEAVTAGLLSALSRKDQELQDKMAELIQMQHSKREAEQEQQKKRKAQLASQKKLKTQYEAEIKELKSQLANKKPKNS